MCSQQRVERSLTMGFPLHGLCVSMVFIYVKQLAAAAAKLLQSYPTLCNPTDSSLPGSSIPGILKARILEWVAISNIIFS